MAMHEASAVNKDGHYIDLKMGRDVDDVPESYWLVKAAVAAPLMTPKDTNPKKSDEDVVPPPDPTPTPKKTARHFYMSAKLDNTRINRDVKNLMDEVISHIVNEQGSNVSITLEVDASTDEGFSRETMQIVTENAKTLKVQQYGFDGES